MKYFYALCQVSLKCVDTKIDFERMCILVFQKRPSAPDYPADHLRGRAMDPV